MPRKYTMRSKEEKLEIVKRNLAGDGIRQLERETGIHNEQIRQRTAKCQAEGETGLKPKPGNPLSRYERRKSLTYEVQLQYLIELLKRDMLKKEAEVLRLKKLNARKEGGARRSWFN